MAEVALEGTGAAALSRGRGYAAGDGADARLRSELIDRAARRAASATWKSSLDATDLACLMGVIETQLLPRLLREYRPADRTPLQTQARA